MAGSLVEDGGEMIRLMAAFLAGVLVTYIVMSNVVNQAGDVNASGTFAAPEEAQIGRASCRERV